MRVSTRVEYGMLALVDIAMYSESGSSVSTADIAGRENISQKYLEQILPLLRQAGLIKAQKGLKGGYYLSRSADKFTMSDILNALDNSILEEMEVTGSVNDGGLRDTVNSCLWGRINSELNRYVENMSFADFLSECRNNTPGQWDLYSI
ncbi:MAG: Rrf2 family transcriptional regulator [Lachnospiraceae bacterium]|nr:Rrf2 family transcriptional regulator [Lachnospiraceae bacterium]